MESSDWSVPDSAEIEAQLSRILCSSTFSKAPRARELLRFVVLAYTHGEPRLKETTIGVEVFSRKATYDPTQDTVVRVNATRLRKKLQDYYAAEGRADPWIIQLPMEGYLPRITRRTPVPSDSLVASSATPIEGVGQCDSEMDPVLIPWRQRPLVKWAILAVLSGGLIGGSVGVWQGIGHPDPAPHLTPIAIQQWGRLLVRATSEGMSPTIIRLRHRPLTVAVSPDGRKLYAGSDRFLSAIDTRSGETHDLPLPLDLNSSAESMVMSAIGRRLYLAWETGDVGVIETRNDQINAGAIRTAGRVYDLAVTADGKKLFMAMHRHGVWRALTSTGEVKQLSDRICPVHLDLDARGQRLYVSYQCSGPTGRTGHDVVEIFDAVTDESLGMVSGPPFVGGHPSISPDGRLVLLDGLDVCQSPEYDHEGCPGVPTHVFHLLLLPGRQIVKTLPMSLETSFGQFVDSGRILFTGASITLMDASQYSVRERWKTNFGSDRMVFLPSQAKAYVALLERNEILVLDAETANCSAPWEGLTSFYSGDGTTDDPVGGAALTASGAVRFESGRVGQAFALDGRSYLVAPWTGYYIFGLRDSSIFAYVKFASRDGEMAIFDRTRLAASGFSTRLIKTTDHRLQFEFSPSQGQAVRLVSRTSVVENRWYQIGVTKTDQQLVLYVNGRAEAHQALGALRASLLLRGKDSWPPLHLGASNSGRDFFHGKLDEVLFYDRALSEAEVHRLYELRQSGPCRI